MKIMKSVSLWINILVLIPVCTFLILDAPWVSQSFGSFSPARGILLAIYMAILLASLALLFFDLDAFCAALLMLQVLYKITTPITVGTFANPVVITNLAIAALHIITLILMFKKGVLGTNSKE